MRQRGCIGGDDASFVKQADKQPGPDDVVYPQLKLGLLSRRSAVVSSSAGRPLAAYVQHIAGCACAAWRTVESPCCAVGVYSPGPCSTLCRRYGWAFLAAPQRSRPEHAAPGLTRLLSVHHCGRLHCANPPAGRSRGGWATMWAMHSPTAPKPEALSAALFPGHLDSPYPPFAGMCPPPHGRRGTCDWCPASPSSRLPSLPSDPSDSPASSCNNGTDCRRCAIHHPRHVHRCTRSDRTQF